jgi:hypothetical protein
VFAYRWGPNFIILLKILHIFWNLLSPFVPVIHNTYSVSYSVSLHLPVAWVFYQHTLILHFVFQFVSVFLVQKSSSRWWRIRYPFHLLIVSVILVYGYGLFCCCDCYEEHDAWICVFKMFQPQKMIIPPIVCFRPSFPLAVNVTFPAHATLRLRLNVWCEKLQVMQSRIKGLKVDQV